MTTCKRCLLSDDIQGVTINKQKVSIFNVVGQCNYCDLHDQIENDLKKQDINKIIASIKHRARKDRYDCLIVISGGFDSSYLLHTAVKTYGLRPLVLHFDNGWNSEAAENNIRNMVRGTGVDFIRYNFDFGEFNKINRAFLWAGVPDADIPNDMAMNQIWNDVAVKYNIKTILNGHNYRYEGSTPSGWSYMDARYIQDVCEKFGVEIKSYPLYTLANQFKFAFKRIKSVRLLWYVPHDKEKMKQMLERMYGWEDYGTKYGGNHGENIYTEFVGSYLLPKKFNITKKIIYLSAMVRSGIISRAEGWQQFLNQPEFSPEKIKLIGQKLDVNIAKIMAAPVNNRQMFKSYSPIFKKYRWLFWVFVKLGYFPLTFYKKYCC